MSDRNPNAPALAPGNPSPDRKRYGGELTLIVDGQQYGGWQAVRVTRGCEQVPSSFDITLTESQAGNSLVVPGSPCVVMLGDDLVLTGYIDRYVATLAPSQHIVRIMGRSALEDMVDSSAVLSAPGMQISGGTILSIARALAAPYSIGVLATSAQAGNGFPDFNFALTETPFEIIERIARYWQVLLYDDPQGNLVIADVGAGTHSSGFTQGVNIEHAQASKSMDGRYQVYIPNLNNTDFLPQFNGPRQVGGLMNNQYDGGVPTIGINGRPRLRQLIVVSEQPYRGGQLAEARAGWEANRRWGRSQAVRVTCDSWRDDAGMLWAPNFYAPISIPALRITPTTPWVIASVVYIRDINQGTVAELVLMPAQAFMPAPQNLQPYNPIIQGPAASGPAAPGQELYGPPAP